MIVIFFVIELDDTGVTAIVMPQKHLVTHCVTGQETFVYRVFDIVVFLAYAIALAQDLVVFRCQLDHRLQLLGVAHKHQRKTAQDGHQGNSGVALAGFVHDHHVKYRFRGPQLLCGNAGGGHKGENLQEFFQVFRV